jgi:hypothetical protein
MRTKILLSAALVAAGIAAADAQQVYSVNAVGYVNVTLVPGYNLIANPLKGTNNIISTILPSVPDLSIAFGWNGAAQQFAQADNFIASEGGWLDGTFQPSTTVLEPGKAFFLQNNSGANATITFVGEVPQGALTNPVVANYGFYSSIVPQSAPLTTGLGFPTVDNMIFNGWNKASQQYADAYNRIEGVWYGPGFVEAEPSVGVAEGFLLFNPAGPLNWTRNFSVNN